jgi:sec-independent protein translocase protein TatB
MFDIGGWEFLVIVVVAIVVIGPKELPGVIRSVSQWASKARELAREFRAGLDELAREVEIDKIGDDLRGAVGVSELEQTAHSIRNEVEDAGRTIEASADPNRIARDEYEEAYTYYDGQTDALPPDVVPPDIEPEDREEASRRQDQRAADAAPTVPAPPSEEVADGGGPSAAGVGAKPGG